jgi:hypothetical protein
MAGMGGFTRPLVSSLTNCWTTRAAMGTALTPAAPMQGLILLFLHAGPATAAKVSTSPQLDMLAPMRFRSGARTAESADPWQRTSS